MSFGEATVIDASGLGEARVIGRKQKGFGVAHVDHFVGFQNRFVNKKAQ
jgi:hypothetical protein